MFRWYYVRLVYRPVRALVVWAQGGRGGVGGVAEKVGCEIFCCLP